MTKKHISKHVTIDEHGRLITSGTIENDGEVMAIQIETNGISRLSNDNSITLGIKFYGVCIESHVKYRI